MCVNEMDVVRWKDVVQKHMNNHVYRTLHARKKERGKKGKEKDLYMSMCG